MPPYIVIRDYGEGYTDKEVCQIADAEAVAIRRRFPGVDVVVVAADDPRAATHDCEQEDEINHYTCAVWANIETAWPFNGGPDAETIVETWCREVHP
jgi:hypothetical protein